ncbi:PilZ domain-containing protein [Desulfotalea psychrophila]|uniref:PilZ domain-containing protein n=1 Tax=Desulfotalea psychrophila (strain LSv54 / DSM 12343) TaxID=177439 RepID=Q6ANZ2_DESPS|nr:PilZ domain-containing protein [Desulfotalea psychrophila]CAG35932.1 unknown protein [Desulfotalea psychrophila LSv54]
MKVKVSVAKNRLYFKVSKKMSKRILDKLYTEVRFCVADLQPGFHVIADYSESNLIQLNGIPTYRKLMNYLINNGVGEVVRVVGDKSLLYKQVINLTARICGYKPHYTDSLEEAEKIVEAVLKREDLRFHYSELPSAKYIIDETRGTGRFLNLSTGGCAIDSASICPPQDSEITVMMTFNDQESDLHEFTIKARVVRANEDEFSAEFHPFEDKERLLSCLLRQTEHEL